MLADIAHDALLRRREAAQVLTERGFKTSPATLATFATRGGGPVYRRYGRTVLYRLDDLVQWAESRLGPRISSTAEEHGAGAR